MTFSALPAQLRGARPAVCGGSASALQPGKPEKLRYGGCQAGQAGGEGGDAGAYLALSRGAETV